MDGVIFDIKEFTVHDGPGARITVFLKGCPLRCVWCHNPEGLKKEPQLMYKKNLCIGCGRCTQICSHIECEPYGRCLHACANGAISISGEEISAEELKNRLVKNADVLKRLDGGITVSGGEPLMQADFVCELADKLNNVHKAIQTSGYADEDTYKRVIEKFDYIMQDIKLADGDLHKRYTGVTNDIILRNINYLKNSGKEFVFRVPLIPGITDTKENLMAISKIVGDSKVELMKYNIMAGAKYPMVNMKYTLCENENRVDDFARYFKNATII